MAIDIQQKRDFDPNEGVRKHVLGIRCTEGEMSYIIKAAKRPKISRAAVVMKYFNEHRKSL